MSVELQLFLSKLLPLAVLPEGLIALTLIALAISAWRGAHRLSWVLAVAALSIYWISAAPFVANGLMATLENQNPGDPATLPLADVAIVLGGAVYPPSPPRREPELGEAVDRVWSAAQLYRAGRIKRILVVGGNLPWWPEARPEAELIQALLVELGVPQTAIDIGTTSRNTFENASEAKTLMQIRPFVSGLLVTSAWHMPRALAIFKKAGIPVFPAPCDFRASETLTGTLLDWMPQAGAFAMTSAALREWLGYYVYRWRGWL